MSNSSIDIKNLSVQFNVNSNKVDAVRNVSFSLNKGESLGLVGESGSGKSVTALSIMQLLPYESAHHPNGEILFEGDDIMQMNARQLQAIRGNQISMIFQEPMTSLNPLHNVEKQISESIKLHQQLDGEPAREKVLELLLLVGIRNPRSRLNSYPHELSGGQRQRVMIAMALANEPEYLIADEPTTALDVTIQAQILDLLKELQEKLGMAILLISHDLNIVRRYTDRVCVMLDGEIVEQGNTSEVFLAPAHPYSIKLLNAEPTGTPVPVDSNAEELLSTKNLNVWFPIKGGIFARTIDYVKAANNIELSIRKGQTLGIVGESGSGKTTLGLALLRLISSDGEITFKGQQISELNHREMRPFRRELQVVFQDPYGSLSPRMSISEIVSEGLQIHENLNTLGIENKVIEALTEVGIDPEARNRYPHEFSGGQRQRIAIARALILYPDLLILDEPTSALDRTVQSQIVDLLRELQIKHNLTYIFISHDLSIVRALSHDVMVMKEGFVVEKGSAEQVFSEPREEYTKALLSAAFQGTH